MVDKIDKFDGDYAFLSNFYSCKVTYNGITYLNAEAAFQAQKTLNEPERKEFAWLTPSQAKQKGRHVKLRQDWEFVKISVMTEIVRNKFQQNPELAQKLADTDDSFLEEGNWWHDRFWGVCNGIGDNHLGQILMKIREEFKNNK